MKSKPGLVFLTLIFSYKLVLGQNLRHSICNIPDKFLCQAVANGLKTANQQKNATVIQTFRQLKDGLPTGKDATYFLSIKDNKESYQYLNNDGTLGNHRSFPYWPKIKIQTATSWFFDLDTIFKYGEFYPEFAESENSRTYNFYVSRRFSLFHDSFFITRVYTNVEGWVEFDKETRLIKKLYFKHLIPKSESNKHKFNFVDRYTEYDIDFSDDELYPTPVKFVSNMATANDSVTIQVFYKDYKTNRLPKTTEYVPVRYKLDSVSKILESNFSISVPRLDKTTKSDTMVYDAFNKSMVFKMDVDYMSGTKTKTRSCTAVALRHVQNTTYFITNTHCLEFASRGTVSNKTGRLLFVRDNIRHLEDDISVVEIFDTQSKDFILEVGGKISKNDSVELYGYPNGCYKQLTGKVVSTHNNLITDTFQYIRNAVAANIETRKGASGSAILKDNRVAGIMSSIGYLDSGIIKTEKCDGCIPVSFFIDGNAIYKKLVKAGIL